jgi:undecaprenyldiphospho-muramoylpentapeptide beta-N-acetylglucosaminyltransferase
MSQQTNPLRVLFSGGGTGGGVYPALAVVNALKAQHPSVEIRWLGSTHGVEHDLVGRADIPFDGVAGGPIVGVGLRAVPNAFRILIGAAQALRIVRRFRPGALLLTGGWATVPAALACWLSGVPVMIYLPDVEPGSTIRLLSRIATCVAVTASDSTRFFRDGLAVETGYPVRADLLHAAGFDTLGQPIPQPPDVRTEARRRFALSPDLPTLLVFGGSRGARSINRALAAHLPALLPRAQIVHISGSLDWPEVRAGVGMLPAELAARYHPFEYLHGGDMALALAGADLVVSRAGASTLGEFPLFSLPAILVPYPHAWRYQKTNADYLTSRGAAMRLDDDNLTDELAPTVGRLLDDAAQRGAMAGAARSLRRPTAAARIAGLLADLASAPRTESRGERD